MPINLVHSLLHTVESGWDPISAAYADQYAESAWREDCEQCLARLEEMMGGLAGKRVLDLGGGAGQYSILLAKKGAQVTWHDVSRRYRAIAQRRAADARVSVQFSLGYLESAKYLAPVPFDLLFCRLCWRYCRNDRKFAALVYSLVRPGGWGYVESNTPLFLPPRGAERLRYWINDRLWWKIGHPSPPHGRIAYLIQRYPLCELVLDYSSRESDFVIFRKPQSPPSS